MLNQAMLYDILYALAARSGREGVLFGRDGFALAHQAFACSYAGSMFPELWFELPLAGEPWFDLHVLTAREGLERSELFPDGRRVFHPQLFEWFASQPQGVRQLALSHDIGRGCADNPAVQLLVNTSDIAVMCGFLEVASGADAASAYRAFVKRLPDGWYPCYAGLFPSRPEVGLHVECIPSDDLQAAYASDAGLLEAHLRQAGLSALGDTVVPRCQQLARMPFKIEFQFDVKANGAVGSTFGASLRFACPPGDDDWRAFEAQGSGGELMRLVESWNLADDRWQLFEDAAFAKRVAQKDEHLILFNFPAFLKLRWKEGHPFDAKAYFMAGAQS